MHRYCHEARSWRKAIHSGSHVNHSHADKRALAAIDPGSAPSLSPRVVEMMRQYPDLESLFRDLFECYQVPPLDDWFGLSDLVRNSNGGGGTIARQYASIAHAGVSAMCGPGSVFTRFDSFLDERSSLVEFSKSRHFP